MLTKKMTLHFLLTIILTTNLLAQDLSSGVKFMRDEKYSEAKRTFSSLLNSSSKAEAYFYLGQIYMLQNNLDSAKIYYLNGIKSNSEFPLNYAGLVKVNLAANNLEEAEKNQNQAIEFGNDKNPYVYMALAEAYSNSKVKNYDKAIELINKSLKINSKNINAYMALGKIYLSKGNGSDAIKNFERALDLDKKNPEALTSKAKVYVLINNNDDAISLLNEAITNDSSYSPAYNELAELYANIKDYSKAAENFEKYIAASEVTPEKLKRYASILYISKDYAKTINILEDLIKTEKDNPSSIRILAYSYLKLEEIEKSKTYFEKLFTMPSVDFLISDYENYADLLKKTGNDSLAIEYLSKIFAQDSTRKDVLGDMSVLYFKAKNWDGVISALGKKKTLTAQEYFDLSKAYIFNGDKAISEVTQSINDKLSLNDEQLGKIRPALLYYQKDVKDAGNDPQKITLAINKLNQNIESFLITNQKPKWASAKAQWSEEVRTNIELDYAKADSALVMLSQKTPNLALAYLWRARVNSSFDPESESGLAKPFYEQFIERAAKDSAKFKKELIESYSYLGYYYYLQNDNAKSKSFWQEVLALDPENKQASDVIKQLK